MKKLILGALALAALIPTVGHVHAQESSIRSATLAYAWDMDGIAADPDHIIAATALVDSGTSVANANWTILAQPDACRLLDITVVDTNLSVGTLTVAGYGCMGEPKSCVFAFTAGDDTGVKTLTCTDGKGAYYSTVSTVTTGVMTGESDETFALGFTSNSVNGWPSYGRLLGPDATGEYRVDPWASYAVQAPITTSAVASTTVTSVGSGGSFTNVAVNDLLLLPLGGTTVERKVTARASANSITINQAVTIPTAGTTFSFKRFFFSTNPADNLWIPLGANSTLQFVTNVAANADTGGVVKTLECVTKGPGWPTANWVTLGTDTVASGATGKITDSLNTSLYPYNYCRMDFKFGTGDDGDVAAEDISLSVTLRRN